MFNSSDTLLHATCRDFIILLDLIRVSIIVKQHMHPGFTGQSRGLNRYLTIFFHALLVGVC